MFTYRVASLPRVIKVWCLFTEPQTQLGIHRTVLWFIEGFFKNLFQWDKQMPVVL